MEVVLWGLIIVLFVLSLAGVVIPFIPDTLPLWTGFVLHHFLIAALPVGFWWAMGALTALIIGADLLSNLYFVKRYGGSGWSMAGGAIGLIVGPFLAGPLGILVGPLLLVMVIELLRQRKLIAALQASWGTLVGMFGSAAAKIGLQLAMIAWFTIVI